MLPERTPNQAYRLWTGRRSVAVADARTRWPDGPMARWPDPACHQGHPSGQIGRSGGSAGRDGVPSLFAPRAVAFSPGLLDSGILGGVIEPVGRRPQLVSQHAAVADTDAKPLVELFTVGATPLLLGMGPYPAPLPDFVINDPSGCAQLGRQLCGARRVESDISTACAPHRRRTRRIDVDASSVLAGLRRWVDLNGKDDRWVETVAEAFRAADSD